MNIDPRASVAGFPILAVRNFLRTGAESSTDDFSTAFGSSAPEARERLICALLDAGYIVPDEVATNLWRCTPGGERLAYARATRPISRATAERKLQEFLTRVAAVNQSRDYAHRVKRAYVFGSFISTDSERIGDLDLAVELARRESDQTKQCKLEQRCISRALADGRHFGTFIEQIYWPEHAVYRYLKGRSTAISLHTAHEILREGWDARLIFEDLGQGTRSGATAPDEA
jgi:predicted nucleotidyltransferase